MCFQGLRSVGNACLFMWGASIWKMLSVRDVLYLLDVYSGFDRAIEHIRREVREEMEREFPL